MSARHRRAAYRFLAQAGARSLEDVPWVNEPERPLIKAEVERMRRVMLDAAAVEDGPGVEDGPRKPADECDAIDCPDCK